MKDNEINWTYANNIPLSQTKENEKRKQLYGSHGYIICTRLCMYVQYPPTLNLPKKRDYRNYSMAVQPKPNQMHATWAQQEIYNLYKHWIYINVYRYERYIYSLDYNWTV